MRVHKISALCLSAALLSGLLTGCGSEAKSKQPPPGTTPLFGAGATFPAPLYKKWVEEFNGSQSKVFVTYDAVGSGEGTKRFLAEQVDFGASDAALKDEQIESVERGAQLIPTTAGSIVLAYNLPGIDKPLKLKRDVYADIFLDRIDKWNDPRIAASNPGVKLPDRDIQVVARRDSSGTTFAFTNHLSAISKQWKISHGAVKSLDWPGGAMQANGNAGVAGRIKQVPGSIGYVEFGTASRAKLQMAALENKAGKFVEPTGQSGMATLRSAKLPDNLRAFFPDPDGEESYPIVTFTWLLVYRQYPEEKKRTAMVEFIDWCLTKGQDYSEALGYIRLDPSVAQRGKQAAALIQ